MSHLVHFPIHPVIAHCNSSIYYRMLEMKSFSSSAPMHFHIAQWYFEGWWKSEILTYVQNLSSSISRFLYHCRNSTYLQIRARISPLPVAKRLLLGLGATEMTIAVSLYICVFRVVFSPEFLCPCNIICALPVLGSQNCTPRSLDPLITQCPSGVKQTLKTKSLKKSTPPIKLPHSRGYHLPCDPQTCAHTCHP